MTKLGPNEKLYPVVKIAMVVDALGTKAFHPKTRWQEFIFPRRS